MIVLTAVAAQSSVAAPLAQYRMDTVVDPVTRHIEARVEVLNPGSDHFCLNKSLSIRKIEADGKTIPVTTDANGNHVIGTKQVHSLSLIYDGTFETQTEMWARSGNTLNDTLVELALFSCWYPQFDFGKDFTFTLSVTMPKNFQVLSNARKISEEQKGDRVVAVWKTERPTFDMVLIAAPALKTVRSGNVTYYYRDLPDAMISRHAANADSGWQELTRLYGALPATVSPSVIYAPREGVGGYSRVPLIILPEAFVAKLAAGTFEPMKDIAGDALMYWGAVHEMAHCWWLIADMGTRDEWIDEGVAEFTAIRAMKDKFPADGEKMLASYRQALSTNRTTSAIAETLPNSPDRYLNWYQKTTLVFFAAQDKYGAPAIDRLLRAFRDRFAGTHAATTEAFLEEAQKQIGPEARDFFKAELYRPAAVVAKK